MPGKCRVGTPTYSRLRSQEGLPGRGGKESNFAVSLAERITMCTESQRAEGVWHVCVQGTESAPVGAVWAEGILK